MHPRLCLCLYGCCSAFYVRVGAAEGGLADFEARHIRGDGCLEGMGIDALDPHILSRVFRIFPPKCAYCVLFSSTAMFGVPGRVFPVVIL